MDVPGKEMVEGVPVRVGADVMGAVKVIAWAESAAENVKNVVAPVIRAIRVRLILVLGICQLILSS